MLQCPELDEDVVNASPESNTALIWAVEKDKPTLVKALLEQPNIDLNKEGGLNELTPLTYGAFWEHTEIVELLLADPRYVDTILEVLAIIL